MKEEITTYFQSEMKTGKLLTIINEIIGLIVFFPGIFCLLINLNAIFYYDPDLDTAKAKIVITLFSLLLISFYRYIFYNPFYKAEKKIIKNKRLNFWLQVIIVNFFVLTLFIYFFGTDFFTYLFAKNATKEGILFFSLMYLPIIPMLVSIAGLVYNLKQSNKDISI